MEELGIGRPSTYASILQVLKDRGYVRLDKKRLIPEDKGRVLTAFLESFFARYVEYDFTANLEEQLDQVSNNEIAVARSAARLLARLHRRGRRDQGPARHAGDRRARRNAGAAPVPAARGRHRSAQVPELRRRPDLAEARQVRRLHRLLELSRMPLHPPARRRRRRPAAAACASSARIRRPASKSPCAAAASAPTSSSAKPTKDEDGKAVKPKRASLPKGVAPDDIDLERALELLSLPREVGKHPEDGEPILAGIGRFGPYVKHGKTYASLEAGDDVLTIGLNRAVTLIEEKKANPGKGRRFGADPGKQLGEHPQKGGPIVAKNGRYGPYVSHNGVNATLPNDKTPETITLDEAVALLDARAERTGGGSTRGASARRARQPPQRRPHRRQGRRPSRRSARAASRRGQDRRASPRPTAAE